MRMALFGKSLMTVFASICLAMSAWCDSGSDSFDGATQINGSEGVVSCNNASATTECADEPEFTKNHSVWWKWQAPNDVTKAALYAYGSDFDAVIGVYTGAVVGAMVTIATNDDHDRWGGVSSPGTEYASLVSFDVTPGTTYYICVGGKDEKAFGNIKLGWCFGNGFSLVTGDEGKTLLGFIGECADSLTIPSTITKIEQSAFDCDCNASVTNLKSVVIPQGITEIGLYAFCKCANLSSVTFEGGANDIIMDSYWVFYDTPFYANAIDNDNWGDAIELSDAEGSVAAWNGFATTEVGEPDTTKNRSLWWKWTAPDGAGTATFQTQGSDFDAVLGVYSGTAVDALTQIQSGSGTAVSLSFAVTPGATYYVCVAGNGALAHGNVKLSWTVQSAEVPDSGGSGDSGDSGDVGVCLYEKEDVVDAVPYDAASVYNGYLYNGNVFVGTIQVKVGKPNKNTGLANVKATIVLADGKKTLKAAGNGKVQISTTGVTTVSLVGGASCEVTLGTNGMVGKYGDYDVNGARDTFSSKDAADKAVSAKTLADWQGAMNVAWLDEHGWNGISVSIANKGKANVSGSLAAGTKVSAKAQLSVGENWCCVPVLVTKKTKLAFMLWLPRNGQDAGSPGVVGIDGAIAGKPGSLKAGAAFRIGVPAFEAMWGRQALPYLPNGVAVEGGAKWTLPKAGKVAYARGTTEVDATKLLDNPSALKLNYKAKDGTFKGSFKAYAEESGKPKATTVNVVGVLVDGIGYGTATVKKVGSVPVTVE